MVGNHSPPLFKGMLENFGSETKEEAGKKLLKRGLNTKGVPLLKGGAGKLR